MCLILWEIPYCELFPIFLPQKGKRTAFQTHPVDVASAGAPQPLRFPGSGKASPQPHLAGSSCSEVKELLFDLGVALSRGIKSTLPNTFLGPRTSGVQTPPSGFKLAGPALRALFRAGAGGAGQRAAWC